MKKSILLTMVLALILSLCGVVNAYSTNDYSIDISDDYYEVSEGSFLNEDGYGINVQVTKNQYMGDPYTDENLNSLENEIKNNVDEYKEEIAASLKETYGSYYSDDYIKSYVNSFKCNSVDKKEITTVSKNNYKCFHILANYQMGDYSYYCDQYQVVTTDNLFTITISGNDKYKILNDDMKKALDSFEIKNYSDPANASGNNTLKYIAIGVACGAVAGLLSYVFNKNRKKKENM